MRLKFLLIIFCLFVFNLSVLAQINEPKKIDTFEEFDCEALKLKTFYLLEEIKKTPQSKGYVIIYDGKYKSYKQNSSDFEYILPRINEVDTRIQLIKAQLQWLDYPPRNVIFIKGGIREKLTVEYFVVPNGAETPKSTPTLKKIKHRKGKAPKISHNFAAC
jgi:hypothetical protein